MNWKEQTIMNFLKEIDYYKEYAKQYVFRDTKNNKLCILTKDKLPNKEDALKIGVFCNLYAGAKEFYIIENELYKFLFLKKYFLSNTLSNSDFISFLLRSPIIKDESSSPIDFINAFILSHAASNYSLVVYITIKLKTNEYLSYELPFTNLNNLNSIVTPQDYELWRSLLLIRYISEMFARKFSNIKHYTDNNEVSFYKIFRPCEENTLMPTFDWKNNIIGKSILWYLGYTTEDEEIPSNYMEYVCNSIVFEIDNTVTESIITDNMTLDIDRIFQYLPSNIFLIKNLDSNVLTLVTLAMTEDDRPILKLSLVFLNNYEISNVVIDLETMSYNVHSELNNIDKEVTNAISIINHILNITERKVNKCISVVNKYIDNEQDSQSLDYLYTLLESLENTECEPVFSTSQIKIKKCKESIQNTKEIYKLTKRTYKLLSRKGKSPFGFEMIPHLRRGHYQRFWVGTGEHRRKEVRWIKPLIVNEHKIL